MFPTRRALVACAVAAIVVAPYTALLVPFQTGLRVQLAVIAFSLAVAWAAMRTGGPGWLCQVPRPVLIGLLFYAGATVWGVAVGLAAGNPLRYIASQGAAMLLLPLGAVAFGGTLPFKGRTVAVGAAAAAAAALAIHGLSVAFPGLGLSDPHEPLRFLLRNDANVAGAAPLLGLLLLGYWLASRERWALAGWLGAVVLVVGIMSRGGWLVSVLGMTAVLLALTQRRRVVAVTLALASLGFAAAWAIATGIASGSREVLFDSTSARGGDGAGKTDRAHEAGRPWCMAVSSPAAAAWVTLVERLDHHGAGLEVRLEIEGPAEREALLVLEPVLPFATGANPTAIVSGSGVRSRGTVLLRVPRDFPPARLGFVVGEGNGQWAIHSLRVVDVGSRPHLYLWQFNDRCRALVGALFAPRSDKNLGYRAKETRAVCSRWRHASLLRQVAGHGLGATFEFANSSWDERGHRTTVATASYIHNFYIFLGFKLGVAGLAALTGLILILKWAWRESARPADDISERWPVVVLAVGLTVYLAWSITSPEIYDFRVAPLWGVLVALAAVCRAKNSQ